MTDAARLAQEPWTWVQPFDRDALLTRLLDARDLHVPQRERENLCGCAYTEIRQLQRELAAERATRAALEQALEHVLPLLHPRDCGVHYCRYCEAGTSNHWEHHPSCAYASSVKDVEAARTELRSLLPRLGGEQPWNERDRP